jgi:folate-dependent phosphoribosylglycinamide formyltransferase PurN
MKRPWITLFSQTGTEIVDVCNKIGRIPALIITNKSGKELENVHPYLLEFYGDRIISVPKRPTLEEYQDIFKHFDNPLITLHGWLRIIPEEICNSYEIVNGHPGLITKYPELKGFNPQEKAFHLRMKESGCVLHKVTAGVDEGPVIASVEMSIENLELNEIFTILRDGSIQLWENYLKNLNLS